MYVGEDWSTEGDWVGRLGRQYAVLFAGKWPFDEFVTHGAIYYQVDTANGPNHPQPHDVVRRWMHWRNPTQIRCLYDPRVGHRVQSELDDHGEAYPLTLGGPDERIWLAVPEGINVASLYFVNKDGHTGANAIRDYRVQVFPVAGMRGEPNGSPLATARVRDFWGGVYERFAVTGPATYMFEVQRSHSLNAICSAVFVDRLSGPSTFLDELPLPAMGDVIYNPPSVVRTIHRNLISQVAANLWSQADLIESSVGYAPLCKILAYRSLVASSDVADSQLSAWRWQLRLWTMGDRASFDSIMQRALTSEQAANGL